MSQKNKRWQLADAPPGLYQDTIDAIDAVVHMVDRDLRVQLVNKQFYTWTKQLGLTFDSVIGQPLFKIFPFLPPKVKTEYDRIFRTGETMITDESTEVERRVVLTETRKIPVLKDDTVTGVVTMITDVTAARHDQQELAAREKKFRMLFEKSNDPVFLLAPDGIVLDCNEKSTQLLGLPKTEIIGREYIEFVVADYHKDSRAKFDQLTAGQTPSGYEKEFIHSSGKKIPVEINPAPMMDDQGNLLMIQSVVRDISERKRAQHLQRILFDISEQTFTSRDLKGFYEAIHRILGELMNVNNFYIAVYDPGRELLSFPYFIDEQDPVPEDKTLGKGLTEYVLRTETPLLLTPELSRQLESEGEVELIGTDCVSWLGIPLKSSVGDVFGVLVVQSYDESIRYSKSDQDVLMFVSQQIATAIERKRTEEILRETEIQFHHLQKIESIGALVSALAHDYNNILTSILGNAQMLDYLLKQKSDDEHRHISAIIKASEDAAGLVRQLLVFSREEKSDAEAIDINRIVTDWSGLIEQAIGETITFKKQFEPSVTSIHGSPQKVRQLIMNLVVNARDAMPGGGNLVISTSRVSLKEPEQTGDVILQPGSYVKLSVADNGVGMTPEIREKMFVPFFSTKPPQSGTGLGLSIVRRVVDEMGGVIAVESAPERGTTVDIFFPAGDGRNEWRSEKRTTRVLPGKGEKILVAEDDEGVRSMLVDLLENHLDYSTLQAGDGAAALALLAENRVALVITDLKMPDMDGVALAKSIHRRFSYLKSKLVAITAYHGMYDPHSLEKYFVEVLQKPIPIETLSRVIKQVLSR